MEKSTDKTNEKTDTEKTTKQVALVKLKFTDEVEEFPSDAPEDHAHIINLRLFPFYYPIRTRKVDVKVWDAVATLFHRCGYMDDFRCDDQTSQIGFRLKGREPPPCVIIQKRGRHFHIGRNTYDGEIEKLWILNCKIGDDGAWKIVRARSRQTTIREDEVVAEDGTRSTKRRRHIRTADANTEERKAVLAREMGHFLIRNRCFSAAHWGITMNRRRIGEPRTKGDWLELPWTCEGPTAETEETERGNQISLSTSSPAKEGASRSTLSGVFEEKLQIQAPSN